MKYFGFIGLLLVAACAGIAQQPKAWSSVPLAKWTEANTVDSCTEGLPPEGAPAAYPADGRAQASDADSSLWYLGRKQTVRCR